jgi:hypothetical protein
LRKLLDQLVATGEYRDYSEVIEAAIRNQALMEQEIAAKGQIVIATPKTAPLAMPDVVEKSATVSVPTTRMPVRNGVVASSDRARQPAREVGPRVVSASAALEVPAIFRLDGFPKVSPNGLAALPPDLWSKGQQIPLDRWVLGQQNRLMPAKVNSRALVRLFLDSPKGLNITQTARDIAVQAAALREYLQVLDCRHAIARDDAMATAFPTREEYAEDWIGAKAVPQDVMRTMLADRAAAAAKSQARYANQFVVSQNSKGELSGLMVDLKLVNVVAQRKERLIVPTKFAYEFAALPNPVLDRNEGEKFSAKERMLFLRHIAESVPVEAYAYRTILDAVRRGRNTPESIDEDLRETLPPDRAGALSQSFLASQRSGAISRMSDLGLIERRREGVRVSYSATENGMTFLNQRMTD